jgi:hypothetical protein
MFPNKETAPNANDMNVFVVFGWLANQIIVILIQSWMPVFMPSLYFQNSTEYQHSLYLMLNLYLQKMYKFVIYGINYFIL